MSRPILYSFRRCPYAIRARLAIHVSQFQCQLREVLLRNKPAALIEASAKATVPVLVFADGRVIDQSLDIMLHVLKLHDPFNWLDIKTRSNALQLIEASETRFKPHLDLYKYASREIDPNPEFHRSKVCEFFDELEARLSNSIFLLGEKMSLADAAILPFIRQFAQTDRQWFDQNAPRSLKKWLEAFEGSDLRSAVMNKYIPWQPDDEEIVFPALPK